MEEKVYTMTMRDYLRVLFRQKAVIITCIITVMVVVIIGLKMRTPVYEAQVKMLVSGSKQVESPYYRALMTSYGAGSQPVLTQSEIVTSAPVMELSVNALGLSKKPLDYETNFSSLIKKPVVYLRVWLIKNKLKKFPKEAIESAMFQNAVEELRDAIKVEPVRDTDMFTISVRDYSPVGAAIMANVVSRAYVIFDLEQQLAELQMKYGEKHSMVMQMKDSIEKMAKSLNGQPLSGVDAIGPASVKIIEQASVPQQPSGLPNLILVILALFMSVFLAIMLAFTFEYLDQTFKSPWDIERYLNIPFLGFAPRSKAKDAPVIQACIDSSPYCRAFHNLSDQMFLVIKDKGLKSLLLTSAEEGEGVTTTISNLGSYLANIAKHKVLIIDANLRNPRLHEFFKIKNDKGLGNILEVRNTFDSSVDRVNTHLSILTAGKTDLNPVTLLDSHKMAEIFKLAKEQYKVILVDSPALNDHGDALMIASYVDATCLVVNEGKTRRQVVEASLDQLRQKKVNIIGAILNNRTFSIPQVIYDRV